MRNSLLFPIVLLMFHCIRATAEAGITTFQLSGTLDSVSDSNGLLPLDVTAGIPFSGVLFYDDTAADELSSDLDRGEYHFRGGSGLAGLVLILAGHEFRTDPDALLRLAVGNNVSTGIDLKTGDATSTGDTFDLLSTRFLGPVAAEFQFISFYWRNPTGSLFSDDALPSSLSGDAFDQRGILLSGFGATQLSPGFQIQAQIDSITIPEPSGFVLASIAAVLHLHRLRRFLEIRSRLDRQDRTP